MQATATAKRFVADHLQVALIAAGVLVAAVTSTVAVTLTSNTDQISAPSLTAPITADDAYTIEAELVAENQKQAQEAARQMTPDAANDLEAAQVAHQRAAQERRRFLTSDEGWVIEQALLTEQTQHNP
jgi:hypothetical protein